MASSSSKPRVPLQGHTSLSGFRRSLIAPPASRKRFGIQNDKENDGNRPPSSSSAKPTKSSVKQTPLSHVRKSIRSTLSPAITPTSLLKNELELDDNEEESMLLCSPAAVPLQSLARKLGPPQRIKTTTVAVSSPAAIAKRIRSATKEKSSLLLSPTKEETTTNVGGAPLGDNAEVETAKVTKSVVVVTNSDFNVVKSAPESSETKESGLERIDEAAETTTTTTSCGEQQLDDLKANSPTERPSTTANWVKTAAKTNLRITIPASTHTKQPLPTLIRDPAGLSPITPRGNGVCMDLSHMFQDATNTTVKVKPTATKTSVVDKCNDEQVPVAPSRDEEAWAERQCELFTNWLNYTIQPTEDRDHQDGVGEECGSEDRMALRTLLLHQRMAAARLKALEIFNGNDMGRIRETIETEIARGRLSIRKDRNLTADLTMRRKVIELLFSYSTPWLRLGLETLFGEAILPESPQQECEPENERLAKQQGSKPVKLPMSRMKLALKKFIVQRVLADETILRKYTKGKCSVPSGKFETMYNAEMRTMVLYRLLVLFFFLDRAKEDNVLSRVPHLFVKDAPVKSTKDVLLSFCRDFLSAEGNFVKHLSRMGLKVFYVQLPIDELNFEVTNLAVDLRDGVRLARMTEILTNVPRNSIISTLRLPSVSRLQKLHNLTVVIRKLREIGVPLPEDVSAHHIVDGHREIVLKLMWSVVSQCCLKDLLNVETVQAEIRRVERLVDRKYGAGRCRRVDSVGDGSEDVKSLLSRWSFAVCAALGLQIDNLTTDFADGRAFCFLVHFYHPHLLLMSEIKPTTNSLPMRSIFSEEAVEKARANERANAELANKCLSDLGGIPKMIPVCDTSIVPDEESVLMCLSFMCSRLLESTWEIRSCVLIQRVYRRYRRAIDRERKLVAASIIVGAWRSNKTAYYASQLRIYGQAVQTIENFILRNKDSLQRLRKIRLVREKLSCAAIVIQSNVRRLLARSAYLSLREVTLAAISLQCQWRRFVCRRWYFNLKREKSAAKAIQHAWRRKRQLFAKKDIAAIQIQRIWRGFWSQVQYHIDLMDVIAVQSCVRRILAVRQLQRLRCAARAICSVIQGFMRQRRKARLAAVVKIQSLARRKIATKRISIERHVAAVVKIQSFGRMILAKHALRVSLFAACRLQSFWRKSVACRRFKEARDGARCIQVAWMRYSARRRYRKVVQQVILCQSCIRKFLSMVEAGRREEWKAAAKRIQACFRGFNELKKYRKARMAIVRLQSMARWSSCVRRFRSSMTSIRLIQSEWRKVMATLRYQQSLKCIVASQMYARRYLALCRAAKRRGAIVSIQRAARAKLARRRFKRRASQRKSQIYAATKLQSAWRCFSCWSTYQRVLCRVIQLQSFLRGGLANKFAKDRRRAVVTIHSFMRGSLARREACRRRHAVVAIQACWRRLSSIRRAQDRARCIISIQSALRSKLARCRASCRLQAAVSIQSAARCYTARRSLARRREGVVLIQRLYRGYLLRRELSFLDDCAAKIQATFRGFRSWLSYEIDRANIEVAQSVARMWLAKREAVVRRKAAVLVQKEARRFLARGLVRHLFAVRRARQQRESAARTIQRYSRGILARHLARRESAARMIQKTWRCYTIHVDFLVSILSAIQIQTVIRAFLCRRRCANVREGIVKIQSAARALLCRRRLARLHSSATLIQAQYRSFSGRSSFLLRLFAAVEIQRHFRGFVVRTRVEEERYAAEQIQRIWRGYVTFVDFVWSVLSAVKIQTTARVFLARIEAERRRDNNVAEFYLHCRSAKVIQKSFRRYKERQAWSEAARAIQIVARKFLSRLVFSKLCKGVVRFQSVARGRRVRRRRSKRVVAQVKKIRAANVKAIQQPELRLGNRAMAALEVLLKSESLTEIMRAIGVLELATRVSEVCCVAFAEARAPDVLFSLVRQCNRSLPHIELLHNVLLTMSNVARYDYLLPSMSSIAGVEVYLDLVQMFRDKDGVFYLASSLLERVVRCNPELEPFCGSKENLKRLKAVNSLCMRKIAGDGRRLMGHCSVGSMRPPRHDADKLRHGILALQRLIRSVDKDGNASSVGGGR